MKQWLNWKWGVTVGLGIIFFGVGITRLDPDFGWHYKMGEYIWQHGSVPGGDPFSYTMSSFKFVDHEWLSNLALYWGYKNMGQIGLAALFAGIVMAVVWLGWSGKNNLVAAVGWILAGSIFFNRGGVRPQVEMWLLVVVLIKMLLSINWNRWRWVVPIVLWGWANLHGSFGLGIVILGIYVAAKSWETRKVNWKDVTVLVMSTGITLINPYGLRLWYEVWMQLTDGRLRWNIQEWQPFYMHIELGMFFLALLLLTFGWRVKQKVELWKWLLVVITFLAALGGLRHGSLFVILGAMLLPEVIEKFTYDFKNNKVFWKRMRVFWGLLVGVAVMIMGISGIGGAWLVLKGAWLQEGWYPGGAIRYLRDNPSEGKMLNEYGWGGYLIWKYPEKKVFIDGRMPSWRESELVVAGDVWATVLGHEAVHEGESKDAFGDYLKIVDERKFELLDKYGVKIIVWPVIKEEKNFEAAVGRWVKSWWPGQNKKKENGLIDDLIEAGWRKTYEDGVAVILAR